MHIWISFPDTDFTDISFTVTPDTRVREVVEVAATEWKVDADVADLLISYSGRLLPLTSLLMSHGIEAESQLVVSARVLQKQNLEVVARICPLTMYSLQFISVSNDNLINVLDEYQTVEVFEFDKIFCSSDELQEDEQESIFQEVGVPAVSNALDGYNSCIFTMGGRGSGKTYTIFGTETDPGLVPRMAHQLFSQIENTGGTISVGFNEYVVEISFIEIRKETIIDLLLVERNKSSLKVYTDPPSGVYVGDLTKKVVTSNDEVLKVVTAGLSRRTTVGGNHSSLSNAILQFHIRSTNKEIGMKRLVTITLVDLMVSDTLRTSYDCLMEGNRTQDQSLMVLKKVIRLLADPGKKKKKNIPYRESKLTHLLSNCFGGNCKTTMIATMSAATTETNVTIGTLRCARHAKKITNKLTNEDQIISSDN